MIEVNGLSKRYGDKVVLDKVSLKNNCKAIALMGESGTGKTTLMRIIAGLEKEDEGSILVEGKTAVSFAEPRLFDSFSVLENVTCVMSGEKGENEARAQKILERLGIGDAGALYPAELSSGMAARVSIARALAYDADNYLFDEPFRALDDDSRFEVISYLKNELSGKTVMMITHNLGDATAFCDEIYKLDKGILNKIS